MNENRTVKPGADDRRNRPFVVPGHFYSPLGNRKELRAYYASEHYAQQCARVDAMLDYEAMKALWARIEPQMLHFPMMQTDGFRYYGLNNQLAYFDASILSGLISELDPARVIEIGAGYSSAAMFDTFDRRPNARLTSFTTIDPDLSRIKALNPSEKAQMIAAPVQSLPIDLFQTLQSGDVLFIDSSHVLKTGSDVHFEYLHILPRLASGVIVHIHDIHYPLEYPRGWAVQENRSWNEVYLVDMMLTHGRDYEVMFFNDAFLKRFGEELAPDCGMFQRFAEVPTRPTHLVNGSIWLRKR